MKLSEILFENNLKVSWYKPDMSEEHEEMERTSEDLEVDLSLIEDGYEKATLEDLTDDMWRGMENTDSWDIGSLDDAKNYALEYGKDIESIIDGFKSGESLPAPIVLIKPDGGYYLIAGNTRLMVARAFGIVPKVAKVFV